MIVAAGLGPAGPELIPEVTWRWVKGADEIFVRTRHHPAVEGLTAKGVFFESFDWLYEETQDFESVYQAIVDALLGREVSTLLYLVPGSPLVAERSVALLREACRQHERDLKVEIAPSFLDLAYRALEIDPASGLAIRDAYDLVEDSAPWPESGLLITQVHSKLVAGQVKLALLESFPPEHPVWVLSHLGLDERVCQRPLRSLDWDSEFDHLTSLYLPAQEAGGAVVGVKSRTFYRVMKDLLGDQGCPWDRKQTHRTLRPFLLEECHEVLQAIDLGDEDLLAEELGDVLLQVYLHAVLAERDGEFTLVDVIDGISEKMIRRHPHVFGQLAVSGADEVLSNWEAIKREEKQQRSSSLLEGIPSGLSALLTAMKVQSRASRWGFDWDDESGPRSKVKEEALEVERARDSRSREEELGDLLFSVVNWARFLEVDPEAALRSSVRRFDARWQEMVRVAQVRGLDLSEMNLDELDKLWEEAKKSQ